MAHMPHRRQNSVSDNSYSNGTPSSAVSEGSETFEATSTHEWQFDSHNSPSLLLDNLDLQLDSLSLENSISEITDHERAQIESFFSGLGTEVSEIYFPTKFVCKFSSSRRKAAKMSNGIFKSMKLVYSEKFARDK